MGKNRLQKVLQWRDPISDNLVAVASLARENVYYVPYTKDKPI